jgi:hypothetical protein
MFHEEIRHVSEHKKQMKSHRHPVFCPQGNEEGYERGIFRGRS